MASQRLLYLFFVLFTSLIGWLQAYQFNVGGQEGWVSNPSESYNPWAQRMRFQVNDTLLFKYMKGLDSVLVVTREDYDNCNTKEPIVKMDGGDSVFKLDRSGPFYFISGNKTNCQKGQKLIVVVLAVRIKPVSARAPAPAPSPESFSPAPSPFLVARPPSAGAPAPTPVRSHAPVMTPTTSPPTLMAPTPSALAPPVAVVAPTPGGNTGDMNSPEAARHSSAADFTRSVIFMQSATLVLSVCMGI
ncbi:early nodulin-like protein 3 [Rhododendron vialii]|uniref:early nodulin-like protein 3 n=1 Tax=Rhododendron vialii TaxID=182163 RepID=UPI00265FD9DD|nr:early nodulin-like protein 3 [Rhododendron vialii]